MPRPSHQLHLFTLIGRLGFFVPLKRLAFHFDLFPCCWIRRIDDVQPPDPETQLLTKRFNVSQAKFHLPLKNLIFVFVSLSHCLCFIRQND